MKPGLRKVVDYSAELKRRKVFRTTVAYASVAVVIALGVAQLYDVLLLPDWTPRLVIVLLVAGLPVAIALSWAYDIRSDAPPDAPALPAAACLTKEFDLVTVRVVK